MSFLFLVNLMDKTASGHFNLPFFGEEVVAFFFCSLSMCIFKQLCFITLPNILLSSFESFEHPFR